MLIDKLLPLFRQTIFQIRNLAIYLYSMYNRIMNFTSYKQKVLNLLRWSEMFTKTDMVYLAKGGFWFIAGKIVVFLAGFITMIAFANWLPQEEYGAYQFVLAGLAIFSIFTLSGINFSLIKSVAQGKEGTLRLALKEKIKWGIIGSIVSLGLAVWYFLQGNDFLAAAFLVGAFFVPFKETFRIFAEFWSGRKKFDILAKYEMISAGLSTLLLIPAIYLTNNVLIIITVFLAGHTFFDWIFYRRTEKQIMNKEEDRGAVVFGKHLTLMSALLIVTIYLDRVIIWHFLGAVPLAIYSFALLPIQKIQGIVPIVHLALPKLGENKIDEQRKKGIVSKFIRLFAVSIPSAVFLILIAPLLYKFIFPQYLESIVYFQALSLLIALSPFHLLIASLVAETKKGALYIINTIAPVLRIIIFLALIPQLGLWGIVAAILINELFTGLLVLYFFLKI